MQVKAKPGIKAPLHHRPKDYIPEDRFVQVEDSHYYQSMVRDGDLVEATPEQWAAQQQADAKAQAAAEKAAAKTITAN
jgi:hypothetical protein